METHDCYIRLLSSKLHALAKERNVEESDLLPILRSALKQIPRNERPTELACLMEAKRLRHNLPLVF